jgi:two-component SAPR family response regulator
MTQTILIVEDDFLISIDLAELVEETFEAEASVKRSLAEAMEMADGNPAFAILDIDLGDGKVFPFADRLVRDGVPFTFLSGSRANDLPERFRGCSFLPKPYTEDALFRLLEPHVGRR